MLKRITILVLSLCMMIVFSFTGYATNSVLDKTASTYGIPVSVLESLDSTTLESLTSDAMNYNQVSSTTSYIKFTEGADGTVSVSEHTYSEYLNETKSRVHNTDTSSGWMKFYLTILDIDDDTAQASCAFTWLTAPIGRMRDVVGLALAQGTVVMNTANGFYYHTSPNETYRYTFTSSDIDEFGHGVVCEFDMKNSDYDVNTYDYIFLRCNFCKEGTSEGVSGAYAHKRISIFINPNFSISRSGTISWTATLDLYSYYEQASGYVSMIW